MAKTRVLILCTANSARSQMAEGALRWLAGDAYDVFSAGTRATSVNPFAVRAMREIGVDISSHRSKTLTEFLAQPFDYVITVCDAAAESCPVFPGKAERMHWSFPDPAAVEGEDTKLQAFRDVRDGLIQRLGHGSIGRGARRDAAQGDSVGMRAVTGGKRPLWHRYAAECIGTFAIVFAAGSAAITDAASNGGVPLLAQAFAAGLTVAVMIFALGPVSAAHFNPAVTLGFAVARRFPWQHVPAYVLFQVAGAVLATSAQAVIFGGDVAAAARFGANGSTLPALSTIAYEAVLTFFLMLVISSVATDSRVSSAVPALAIGFTVVACVTFGGLASGASMNPARSLGPALFAGGASLTALPAYLIGPIAGAVLGALCNEALRHEHAHAQSAPADL